MRCRWHLQQRWPVQGSQRTLETWYFMLILLLQAFWIQVGSRVNLQFPSVSQDIRAAGYLVRFQPPWLVLPSVYLTYWGYRLICRAIYSQGSFFFLFQGFLLEWIPGITGSLTLNKWCHCRSRCRWRLCNVLVFAMCTPRVSPPEGPKAGCNYGNPIHGTSRAQRKLLELSLHSSVRCNLWCFCPLQLVHLLLYHQCAFASDRGECCHVTQGKNIWKWKCHIGQRCPSDSSLSEFSNTRRFTSQVQVTRVGLSDCVVRPLLQMRLPAEEPPQLKKFHD